MKKIIFSLFNEKIRGLLGPNTGKIPGSYSLYKFIYENFNPNEISLINVQGWKMYLDTRDKGLAPWLLVKGIYEEYITDLLKQLIAHNMIVVDIGANIGYHTLIMSGQVGKSGRVYAFEPEPTNYELLVKNIRINNCSNVIPIRKAVSNKIEKIKLFIDKFNFGNPSFSKNNITESCGYVYVDTITLDYFFENVVKDKHIDVIKMDAQGAEGLIVEGADKVLRYNDNLKIIMEYWPFGLTNVGTNPLDLIFYFQKCGFKIKVIDTNKRNLKPITQDKIMKYNWKKGHNLLLEKE